MADLEENDIIHFWVSLKRECEFIGLEFEAYLTIRSIFHLDMNPFLNYILSKVRETIGGPVTVTGTRTKGRSDVAQLSRASDLLTTRLVD